MRLNSRVIIATRVIGVVATMDAVRVPVTSRPISPITSPGPTDAITSSLRRTSASPLSMTKNSSALSPCEATVSPAATDTSCVEAGTSPRSASSSSANSGSAARRSGSMSSACPAAGERT
jgi:hypothetical protein